MSACIAALGGEVVSPPKKDQLVGQRQHFRRAGIPAPDWDRPPGNHRADVTPLQWHENRLVAEIAMQVFPQHFHRVCDTHRFDPGRQIGIKQYNGIVTWTARLPSPHEKQLHLPFDHLVVPGAIPNPLADPLRMQPAGAHAVATHIRMPRRQDRGRALAKSTHAFAGLADGRHAFPAPHQVVGIPPQRRRIGRPPGGRLPELPDAGAPAFGAETGPDRFSEAPGHEAGERVNDQHDPGSASLFHGRSPVRVAPSLVRLSGLRSSLRRQPRAINGGREISGRRHSQEGLKTSPTTRCATTLVTSETCGLVAALCVSLARSARLKLKTAL